MSRRLLLLLLWLGVGLAPLVAQDDLIDEFADEFSADKAWWNPAWHYRYRIEITDPKMRVRKTRFVLLDGPSPLFLYNSGRAARELADLRIVGSDGKELPSGVVNFGQDDGHSQIWCKLPEDAGPDVGGDQSHVRLTLYVGNPKAKPLGLAVPTDTTPPLTVTVGPEETVDGKPGPVIDSLKFFDNLAVVECEDLVDSDGRDCFVNRRLYPTHLLGVAQDNPSGGYYLAPDYPWRNTHDDYPLTVTGSVTLPTAGTWYVHVRYKVSEYVYYPGTRQPKRYQFQLFPFTLKLGDQHFRVGENQAPDVAFRYDRFAVELPAGKTPVALEFDKKGAADCIVFTRDPDYAPDIADFNGPVWMRFKLLDGAPPEWFAQMFCFIQPWSSHGPQGESACMLFRDRAEPDVIAGDGLAVTPDMGIKAGQWSPWGRALHSEAITWWTHVRFFAHGRAALRGGLAGQNVAFEFATRPDASRVFRRGQEATGQTQGLYVLMPRRTSLGDVRENTLSFGQWAEKRFDLVQSLGLKAGQGPKKILLTTMARSYSVRETEYIMRTCQLLGFNGIDMRAPMDDVDYWKMADRYGLSWSTQHHWYPEVDYVTMQDKPDPGKTCMETIQEVIDKGAAHAYGPNGTRKGTSYPRTRLAILGDEVGPATNPLMINNLPLVKGAFHEYLQAQGLTPQFFGKEQWSDVDAVWYTEVHKGSELERAVTRIREARGLPPVGYDAETAPPEMPTATIGADENGDDSVAAMMQAEEEKQVAERTAQVAAGTASQLDKRLYYWSQRFRAEYTCHFYGAAGEAISREAAKGSFLVKPKANPNFQAMPIMRLQMWDGGLNVFEWARQNTTDFLFMEDWIMHPYRVAAGMRMFQAAADKHHQELGLLIVGGNMGSRYYAALANGAHTFLSYLYGPLRVIGPPWADHEPTMRQWARVLGATARCEDDILAARNRPAEAAILWAVSTDLNSAYIKYNYGRYPMQGRADLFVILQDLQIPVDFISEEQILEDDALQRYKTLYVVDCHARDAVQAKIRDWVAGGGVLWGHFAALARNEYDEPTTTFDEVFGLDGRPPIEPTPDDAGELPKETLVVPAGNGLPAMKLPLSPFHPAWKPLPETTVLGSLDDGTPALLGHAYDKGYAYLLGGDTGAIAGQYGRLSTETPELAPARRLVSVAADRGGVTRHVELADPRIMSFVSDGPEQTVVYLINCYEQEQNAVRVGVKLPRPPTAAFTGNGGPLAFTRDGEWTRFQVDLKLMDGEVVVFRY